MAAPIRSAASCWYSRCSCDSMSSNSFVTEFGPCGNDIHACTEQPSATDHQSTLRGLLFINSPCLAAQKLLRFFPVLGWFTRPTLRARMEQLVGTDEQRRSQKTDRTQVLIILPNVGRLKDEMPCNGHVHGCDTPASVRPRPPENRNTPRRKRTASSCIARLLPNAKRKSACDSG